MGTRLPLRACGWAVGAVALLAASACGSAERTDLSVTAGPASTEAMPASTEAAMESSPIAPFEDCDDVPRIGSTLDVPEEELEAVRDAVGIPEGLQGSGISPARNRLELDFVDPSPEMLAALAERVPVELVCLTAVFTVEPPSGPLDIIPLDSADDLPTDCWWGGYELSSTRCENRVVLPPGLSHVAVHLNPAALPEAADTSVQLLVTEAGCTSGREMGDALRGPQVIETDEAVLVAFAVVPYVGLANCPDNPDRHATVELSRPLGDRELLHGVLVPPEPIELRPDPDW